MDFDEAGRVAMPFGKYHLWSLARLLAEKPGYVKFLLGLLAKGQIISPRLADALRVYRDSPEAIKALANSKARKKASAAKRGSARYARRRWDNYFNS